MIDRLLDAHVPSVEQLPDWDDVTRRARRPRRRALLIGAVVAAVLVPSCIALASSWFTGTPAPREVKQRFRNFNAFVVKMSEAAAKKGLRERNPTAIASRAYGVLALETADGPVYLWAAPARGGGLCSVLQVYVRRYKRPLELTGCDGPRQRPLWAGVYGGEAFPSGNFVQGRAFGGAVSVTVAMSDGTLLRLPVRKTFFLAQIPKHTHPISETSYDAKGQPVNHHEGPR